MDEPRKYLFDAKDRYTDDANRLDLAINDALRPLIQEWVDKGYRAREIGIAIHDATSLLVSDYVIRTLVADHRRSNPRTPFSDHADSQADGHKKGA